MPTAWPAKTVLKLIFLRHKQMRPQWVTTIYFIVEGIIDIGQSLINTGRGLIDLGRALHVQSFPPSASRRATNCNLSSITEHSFHGITSSLKKGKKCNPCVRYELLPMSRVAQISCKNLWNRYLNWRR